MDDRPPSEPHEISEELVQLVKPELQPGERLLWASRGGMGSPSTTNSRSLAAWIWFFGFATTTVACLAAIPWTIDANRDGPGGLLLVIGLISGMISFFFVIGFFNGMISRRTQRRKLTGQVFALTDRRAIIWLTQPNSSVAVHTFQRGTIKGEDLHRVQYPDGSGDVVIRSLFQEPSGFLGVADVRRVEELVRRFLVVPGQGPETIEGSSWD